MRNVPTLALWLLLAACTQDESAPVDSTVEEITPGTTPGEEQSLADPALGAVTAPAPATATIPTAMQGRWGMTAADCDPGRGDAKGLMTVGAESLAFYESRGVLREVASQGADEVSARFVYSGEGMNWETEETLRLQDNGSVLVRRSSGQGGQTGPFTYRKCA